MEHTDLESSITGNEDMYCGNGQFACMLCHVCKRNNVFITKSLSRTSVTYPVMFNIVLQCHLTLMYKYIV